ncbi:hypothetical protein Goshw_022276, partial [Gossypium schwendimanii]|nr:hypothetical protein [Gossypium schwendimanii]
ALQVTIRRCFDELGVQEYFNELGSSPKRFVSMFGELGFTSVFGELEFARSIRNKLVSEFGLIFVVNLFRDGNKGTALRSSMESQILACGKFDDDNSGSERSGKGHYRAKAHGCKADKIGGA